MSSLMEEKMHSEEKNIANDKKEMVVSLKDLNVYYGDFHAVDNVNLNLEKNKVTALIGPSGCGKKYGAQVNQQNE